MSNERNVEALRRLIGEWEDGYGLDPAVGTASLPDFLASRGVLAPSAVTPAQVKRMDPGIGCINGESGFAKTDCCEECANAWRNALAKIARGEP